MQHLMFLSKIGSDFYRLRTNSSPLCLHCQPNGHLCGCECVFEGQKICRQLASAKIINATQCSKRPNPSKGERLCLKDRLKEKKKISEGSVGPFYGLFRKLIKEMGFWVCLYHV